MSEWISSLQAIQQLRAAEISDPVSTLTHLAEARQIRARASWGRFDGEYDVVFLQELEGSDQGGDTISPWPDIPADFWRWVNFATSGTKVQGEAGVFATTVIYNPEIGDYSDKQHIKLFGVTFHSEDISAVLKGVPTLRDTPKLPPSTGSNAGRKPNLEQWAEFGAALAFVVHTKGNDELRSANALYEATAGALISANRNPLALKTVRMMVNNARIWLTEEEIPPLPLPAKA